MSLEIVNPNYPRGPYRAAIWDFDGTLSLYRGGWQEVMVEMMVAELVATNTNESPSELHELVTQFVVALIGAPTILQMMQLAEEIRKRGGHAEEAAHYGAAFAKKLTAMVEERLASVERGDANRLDHAVPGAADMLDALAEKGLMLFLVSGTEREFVLRELAALGLSHHFGERVYAPSGPSDAAFRKRDAIFQIITEFHFRGSELLGLGDGTVETVEIKLFGGCAIGVASDEKQRVHVNEKKRQCLIASGADIIVPHFVEHHELINHLFD